MKKPFSFYVFLYLIFAVSISSCKKEDTTPNNNPTVNELCDGNSSNSWFPLAVGSYWKYSGSTDPFTTTITKLDTLTEGIFFRAYSQGAYNDWSNLYRVDSAGNVITFVSGEGEFLYVPANPTLNQQWGYVLGFGGNNYRKVESLTDSVITSKCTYANCVRIVEYSYNSHEISRNYYKKGLGLVRQKLFSNSDLTETDLK